MANKMHINMIKQGVEVWNRWRKTRPATRVDLREAYLSRADLAGANLARADMREAYLSEANLERADLRGAYLMKADIYEANLEGADLQGANMNVANLPRANLKGADLSWAYLMRSDLKGAVLRRANLRGAAMNAADLLKADLTNAALRRANLSIANLSGADLTGASLLGADLGGADLTGADLLEANLSEANFEDAKLSQAKFGWTTFGNVAFKNTRGLEDVRHLGPSYIDIHTVIKSNGSLPESFMKGAGLPDAFIDYAKSLESKAIEACSCFISCCRKDEPFAQILSDRLLDRGVRCWTLTEDMNIKWRIKDVIDSAVRLRDRLIMILSANSAQSGWMDEEAELVLAEEVKRKREILVAVRIDTDPAAAMPRWSEKVSQNRTVFDFSEWKNDAAFARALTLLTKELGK